MVMVVIAIAALMGVAALVIDIGLLYVAKQNAQNIADQCAVSALAAINNYADAVIKRATAKFEIDKISGYMFAKYPAMTSGPDIRKAGIAQPAGSPLLFCGIGYDHNIRNTTVNPPLNILAWGEKDFNISVQTTCTIPVDMPFGRLYGSSRRTVSADAVARLYSLPRLRYNFVPWAIKYKMVFPPPGEGDGPQVGSKMTGKLVVPGTPADASEPFRILAVELPGGYADSLAGNAEPVEYGTDLPAEPPETLVQSSYIRLLENQVGFNSVTASALKSRFGVDPAYDDGAYEAWKNNGENGVFADSTRILMALIIAETPEANGSYKVRGFAPLFVTKYDAVDGKVEFVLLSCISSHNRLSWNLKVKPRYTTSMVSKIMLYDFGTRLIRDF
jgi:hypothetical protein